LQGDGFAEKCIPLKYKGQKQMGIPRFHWGVPKDAVGSQFLVFIDSGAQSGKSETFTKKNQ
jgi:hypothetical protein